MWKEWKYKLTDFIYKASAKSRPIIMVLGVILIILVSVFIIRKIFFSKMAGTGEEEQIINVKVRKAAREDFKETYTIMGTIKGAIENDMRFEIDGVLERFNFKEGARIQKGQTICSLDPKDAFTKADFAKSKFKSEQSSYFSASQRLKTYEELFRMKAISESKLQEARYETQSAKSRMKAALSELELAQSTLQKTNLLSPSAGLLAEVIIKPGEYVTPQDVVAKFISGGATNFEVDVPEKDVNDLALGMKVVVNCDSYPDKEFIGYITEIAPTVKERTRTSTIKIALDNSKNLLRSGMFGRGIIYMIELKNVMLVPNDSIVSLGNQASLIPILKPDAKVPGEGTIEMRAITLGQKLTDSTVVKDGILEGELIVVETQGQLSDELKVRFSEEIVKPNK